ncbi:MAG TPA: hypothetical protein VEJ46_11270 [Candidatus Acidoferrum sp.]|nr:hypothetical protein [Candidatus Acidoferrum sp.]
MKQRQITQEQTERKQAQAVRFAETVLDDPDLADDLESLTPEEYAERRGFQIVENPRRKEAKPVARPTRQELEEENEQLWDTLESVRDQLDDMLESDGDGEEDQGGDTEDEDS